MLAQSRYPAQGRDPENECPGVIIVSIVAGSMIRSNAFVRLLYARQNLYLRHSEREFNIKSFLPTLRDKKIFRKEKDMYRRNGTCQWPLIMGTKVQNMNFVEGAYQTRTEELLISLMEGDRQILLRWEKIDEVHLRATQPNRPFRTLRGLHPTQGIAVRKLQLISMV